MAGVAKQPSNNIIGNRINAQNLSRRPISQGKKPLPAPTTVAHVFLMVIMHVCRKVILYDPEIKVCVYLAALLCGSLVSDFMPIPRTYFSQKSNFMNVYFVKLGWAWTLLITGAYLGCTSYVYCCGNFERFRKHLYRLVIATLMWYIWTTSFEVLESATAGCSNDKYTTRTSCKQHGHFWGGFDISGHSFLLIYCSLMIAEEAKSIRGWERIGELIRNESYEEDSPLKSLSEEELKHLKMTYYSLTPYVRAIFILMTLLSILWDVMLVATILYFHVMVQKVVGGSIAICMWYFTYRWLYKFTPPGLPGQGLFKYSELPMSSRTSRS